MSAPLRDQCNGVVKLYILGEITTAGEIQARDLGSTFRNSLFDVEMPENEHQSEELLKNTEIFASDESRYAIYAAQTAYVGLLITESRTEFDHPQSIFSVALRHPRFEMSLPFAYDADIDAIFLRSRSSLKMHQMLFIFPLF